MCIGKAIYGKILKRYIKTVSKSQGQTYSFNCIHEECVCRTRHIQQSNFENISFIYYIGEQAHFPRDTFPRPVFPVLFFPCDTSHACGFPQEPFSMEPAFPTSLFPRAVAIRGADGCKYKRKNLFPLAHTR